ncbi:benzoate-CoA ligase family protein [uncultured Nevskia sp.]|uniref:benzoate-CoA ligase family protein n=1 Tax=uncultured Nevskia sp. TaxID=228950 RepID=UPI0025F44FB4|nr:benzoate-CoA ligase family protein [uncultured Nevskia sp.]
MQAPMHPSTNPTIERPPEQFNFAAHLLALNASRAAKTAYIDDSRTMSYGELASRVRRFAAALPALGLRREERVLLVMQDCVDWPIAFLGCLYAGVVPVAVNTLLPAADYAWMISHSGARAVFTSMNLLPTVQAALAASGPLPVFVSDADAAALPAGSQPFAMLSDQGDEAITAATTHRDDIAFWLYSSGSTGKPKGTVHTQGNLFMTTATYGRHVLKLDESDVTFSAAKLFFAYGLGNALSFPLSVGATVVLLGSRPTAEAVFDKLTRHQPTVFFGVPTLYALMLASPALPARDALRLRRCTSAGEALPKDVGERFTAHYGAPILDGIGSTEMLHIYLSNSDEGLRYGSSGKPVPGYEIRLINEDGLPSADGETGELQVRGDSAALMYWTNRDKSRATFIGDWLKSGDKYVRDAEGWYTYSGRADDMLKVSGQYVSPFEIESGLMAHGAVLEAAVIGTLDAEGLTRCKAFVVLKDGHARSPDLCSELRSFLKARLAPHKVPRDLVLIDELPKTPTGKIQRYKLREREAAKA